MNENNYQKLAEMIERSPRLLGAGGLFGGLNQEHSLMVDFVKFVRGLRIGNNMSPETVNIRSFVAYLGERKNAEEVGRKLYDMRQNGEIVDDPHVKAKNTLLNLAETLFDLGVGEKPENVGGDYEGILRETLSSRAAAQSRSESAAGGRAEARASAASTPKQEQSRSKAEAPGEEKAEAKSEEAASAPGSTTPQGITHALGRDVASPEKPLSTMGESLTDEISIAQGEEDQVAALAVGAETQTGASAIGAEMQAAQLNLQPTTSDTENLPINKNQQQASDILPQTVTEGDEGNLQSEAGELSEDTFRDSGLLRPLTAPLIGEAAGQVAGQSAGEIAGEVGQAASRPAGQATGESLAGTKATPGAERRHIAQLLPDGGRMLRKGPKKHGKRQEQGQGRGTGESGQDQGRQTTPGRTTGQDFANQQAARPQKSGVGRKVAGGAGIAGSLALMKGMYGGAAANAASFGILQTILDLLT